MISVRWVKTQMTTENIKKIDSLLSPFGDWVRFSGTCWLLKTNSNAQAIFGALGSFLTKDDSELIVRVDRSDINGWATTWINQWIFAPDP